MGRKIRLTEVELRRVIHEAVRDSLMEGGSFDIRRQLRVREIAVRALSRVGYRDIIEDAENPRVLSFGVRGLSDEDVIHKILKDALRPRSVWDISVDIDSDGMGVNYVCRVVLPLYGRCGSLDESLNEESYIDWMVRQSRADFDRSPLRAILDDLGLKSGEYSIGGDLGYRSLRLRKPDAEIRLYDDGRIFVHFGYDGSAGAFGGYTRKYEVKDPGIFKRPGWEKIVRAGSVGTSPDVIMR